ncbi:DUF484 domain-containing protein [Shewanella sp. NFH-SH190041]|uniref:DUF484 family protein n=1 Tax=Shewanella sp. NFH-SH190041 TaxID=2950245 RepID=UPI0021C4ADA6|nr:DUF484 family protein [Shewanella sp. NFH-SH190041]BDM62947.1 DUF484 domain-containing protein [Shewanella sp. NFH-SH190041]
MSDGGVITAEQLLDEQIVKEYLLDNPDFFERHADLLLSLRLPHAQRGAISLVERRQELLRSRVAQLEEEITQLMGIARHNETIFRFNCDLTADLLNCDNIGQLRELLSSRLQAQYGFTHVRLITVHDLDSELSGIWSKRLKYGYYFGRLPQAESRRLFGADVGSVALTKLTESAGRVIFAIASEDGSHFHSEMDSMLMDQLRGLLDHMLMRF